jgi:hypothetical protein
LRNIGSIDIATIQEHLAEQESGIAFTRSPTSPAEFYELPWHPNEYQGFRVSLDDGDVNRLVLWRGFAFQTHHRSCKLMDIFTPIDSLDSAIQRRVRPFIEGVPASGKGPLDLRTTANMAIVMVSNDFEGNILYIIDGNHRSIAQYLTNKGFKDIPAFVCIHPRMWEWKYGPPKHKPT